MIINVFGQSVVGVLDVFGTTQLPLLQTLQLVFMPRLNHAPDGWADHLDALALLGQDVDDQLFGQRNSFYGVDDVSDWRNLLPLFLESAKEVNRRTLHSSVDSGPLPRRTSMVKIWFAIQKLAIHKIQGGVVRLKR